jgi:DNA-binding MurR/RpiR family transcriptional regulator
LRQRIRDRFQDLSPHLQRIARASLENPRSFALNTTVVLANELEVQPSTLIRFSKEFGYSGFAELQRVFRQRLIEGSVAVRTRVMESDSAGAQANVADVLGACIEAHQSALARMSKSVDFEAMSRAVQAMRSARHVYVAGLRRSKPIADYVHYSLLRAERSASLVDFAGGMAGPQIATICDDDVLFAIAFPPYSQPVLELVLDAQVTGRQIVALTDGPESPLARAQVALFVDADENSRFQPISAAIALVQALVTAATKE